MMNVWRHQWTITEYRMIIIVPYDDISEGCDGIQESRSSWRVTVPYICDQAHDDENSICVHAHRVTSGTTCNQWTILSWSIILSNNTSERWYLEYKCCLANNSLRYQRLSNKHTPAATGSHDSTIDGTRMHISRWTTVLPFPIREWGPSPISGERR